MLYSFKIVISFKTMFPSITKRLFIIKEIDTASECSNMAVLGNASATPVISIMSPSLASCFQ